LDDFIRRLRGREIKHVFEIQLNKDRKERLDAGQTGTPVEEAPVSEARVSSLGCAQGAPQRASAAALTQQLTGRQ
jgi:hypothetical protein